MRKIIALVVLTTAAITAAFFLTLPLATNVRAQGNCVTLVNDHTFSNGCSRRVTVRWSDQGSCRGGGCSATIGPEDYEQITTVRGTACWTVAWGYDNPPFPRC
jgi:hypothetical protein